MWTHVFTALGRVCGRRTAGLRHLLRSCQAVPLPAACEGSGRAVASPAFVSGHLLARSHPWSGERLLTWLCLWAEAVTVALGGLQVPRSHPWAAQAGTGQLHCCSKFPWVVQTKEKFRDWEWG